MVEWLEDWTRREPCVNATCEKILRSEEGIHDSTTSIQWIFDVLVMPLLFITLLELLLLLHLLLLLKLHSFDTMSAMKKRRRPRVDQKWQQVVNVNWIFRLPASRINPLHPCFFSMEWHSDYLWNDFSGYYFSGTFWTKRMENILETWLNGT